MRRNERRILIMRYFKWLDGALCRVTHKAERDLLANSNVMAFPLGCIVFSLPKEDNLAERVMLRGADHRYPWHGS